MSDLVKLRLTKTGAFTQTDFEHAARILLVDKGANFECADDRYKVVDNVLIKQPKKKKETKPKDEDKDK